MPKIVNRHKKLFIILSLLLLSGALVWAAAKLSGQANALAQDSGVYASEMESLTIAAIRKPVQTKASQGTPPKCDWKKETQIRKAIEQNDGKFKMLIAKAKVEQNQAGAVTEATKAEVTRLANEYKSLCDQYAAMWSACNCQTRARTAKAAGDSRVQSAAVAVNSAINSDLLQAMGITQKEMRDAGKEYAAVAVQGAEIAAADQDDLRTNFVPAANNLVARVKDFTAAVQDLILQIRNNPTGGGSSGGHGGSGRGSVDPVSQMNTETRQLYRDTQTLGGEAREMYTHSQALAQEIAYLSGSSEPNCGFLDGMLGRGIPCFVESAEQE